MPTYEYRCKNCDQTLEVVQAFTDEALTECPACGGELRKVFGNVGISFKGSGFYKNDSRSGAKAKHNGAGHSSSDPSSASPGETSSSDSSSGSSDSSSGSNDGSSSKPAGGDASKVAAKPAKASSGSSSKD